MSYRLVHILNLSSMTHTIAQSKQTYTHIYIIIQHSHWPSSSHYRRAKAPLGSEYEASLRHIKLYSQWVEIMRDYHTVFANSEETSIHWERTRQEVATSLQYRVVSLTRPEVSSIISEVLNNMDEIPRKYERFFNKRGSGTVYDFDGQVCICDNV